MVIRKVVWRLVLFAVVISIFCFWVKNRRYINTLKSIASEGITATNYSDLSGLIKILPGTKVIMSSKNYSSLYGNSAVNSISSDSHKIYVNLNFTEKSDEIETKSGTITLNMKPEINLSNTILFASFKVHGKITGQGYHRSRIQLEIYDINGKAMYGPIIPIVTDGKETPLVLRPTISEPIPLGSSHDNFDLTRVKRIAIRFIRGRYPEGISLPANGRISFDGLYSLPDTGIVVNLFKKPDFQRTTRDSINPEYELRKLLWKIRNDKFFVGLNYPWKNYGWDVGKNPYGEPENSGWSANEEKLRKDFILFKESGITVVRIYLFFDLRAGLEYRDGKLYGFDKYVWKDIETLFKVAGETEIKIVPVLFDFGIADGRGKDTDVGEHPELIFSPEKQGFLIHLLMPLLKQMEKWDKKYGEPVFALELMNEPENMSALLIPGYFASLKAWLQDLTVIIHNETSFKVTLGSHSIVDMQKWWNDLKIDVWQFHFYKYMRDQHEKWPLNLKREDIEIPGPIFCGELEAYDPENNLTTIKQNGYNGVLFWSWNSEDGLKLKETEKMDKIFEWIKLNQKGVK